MMKSFNPLQWGLLILTMPLDMVFRKFVFQSPSMGLIDSYDCRRNLSKFQW